MATMNLSRAVLAIALTLVACGGGSSAPTAHPKPTPSSFKDMDMDQRAQFMKDVVMPQMKPVFVAFDPKFNTFECKTCHGDGAADGTFKMPSAQLPVLPGTEEAFMEYAKDPEHARWAKFMVEQVEPPMAKLLQITQFNPATKTGDFSCEACHTLAK